MASGSGGSLPESGGGTAGRECESCRSAPGIPFCRVEWSFLCAGCAAVVHANNWIVAVPPNPSHNPNSYAYPYHYPYPFPNPNPGLTPDPNLVVQLSSDDDDPSAADREGAGGGRRGRRRSAGKAPPPLRVESVMRYREKRKSRRFDKTVRYETRKVYADQRPRVDGKFARPAPDAGDERGLDTHEEVGGLDAHVQATPDAGQEVRPDASEEMRPVASEELGRADAGEEVGLQLI